MCIEAHSSGKYLRKHLFGESPRENICIPHAGGHLQMKTSVRGSSIKARLYGTRLFEHTCLGRS